MIKISLTVLGDKTRAEALGLTHPVTKLGYVETARSGAAALDALVVALSKHHAGEDWMVVSPPGLKGKVPNGAAKRRSPKPKSRRML